MLLRKQSLLDPSRIAAPCPARWADMEGDDRVRFCNSCKQNVFDVSEMTRAEAEALIRQNSGHVCVRMHVRADGRVLTKDCPVGKAALRKRLTYAIVSGIALIFATAAKASAIRNADHTPAEGEFGQFYASAKEKLLETRLFGMKPTPPPPPPKKTAYVIFGSMR